MTITKEKINGIECTIVWHVGGYETTLGRRWVHLSSGALAFFKDASCLHHIATALPALPKNPQPSDAALLYRYMAEGIHPCTGINKLGNDDSRFDGYSLACSGKKITHATDSNGQRVDVAITEGRE